MSYIKMFISLAVSTYSFSSSNDELTVNEQDNATDNLTSYSFPLNSLKRFTITSFYLIALLFVTAITQAQIVNIPDASFKDALVNTLCVDTDGDDIGDSDADLNNDGEIQVSEAEAVLWLNIVDRSISSLDGIQSFISLVDLFCGTNPITSLDVTQHPSLERLYCQGTQISNLDVTQNLNLKLLHCTNNQLTSLDVTQNPNLEQLICLNNQLTSLDVTQNLNLEGLNFQNNQLTSLDVTQNPNLEWLVCTNNQLTSLDITQNTSLEQLTCTNNQLASLNVTQNPNLEKLSCQNTQLDNLDVTQNSNLEELNFQNNQLTSLDVTQNPNLQWLRLDNNLLNNLDVTQSLNLKLLHCSNNQLTSLDVTQNGSLTRLQCGENQLISLNIQNGNNINMVVMHAENNLNLACIQVDDETATYPVCNRPNGWCKDSTTVYREDCSLGIENFNSIAFAMFPNPTRDTLNVQSKENVKRIKIYSLQGQLIKEGAGSTIDVSVLANGLYFVRILIDSKTFTKPFIKQS